MKIKAQLISGKVFSNSKEAFDLFEKQRLGEKHGEKILYMLSEALFLVGKKKMEIIEKRKILPEKKLFRKFQKLDKKFKTKYFAFKDLREKGYIVKTALKFGAEFRVYEKGSKIGKHHAKWILYPVSEHEQLTWHDFSAKNRVAHSTKKNLLIAVVDDEGDVSYYEVAWRKV
jgi:tRNA-intron endonuclease